MYIYMYVYVYMYIYLFLLTTGLKKVLTAMTLYRKDCAAGIVKLSPSDAFKVAKLQWMV